MSLRDLNQTADEFVLVSNEGQTLRRVTVWRFACPSIAGHSLMATSFLPRNILFPTDFSKSSEAIIGHVVGLASAFNAKVWLLSVVPSLAEFHGVSENYFGQLRDAALANLDRNRKLLETDCLRKLACLQKHYFESVESEICIRSGGVAESIVDYSVEKKADLVMMPTHGLGRMRRFLIGSVTAKVLHDAVCSVWTSPHPRELEPFHPYRHILLAIDNRELPVELLTRASELAEFFHGQLSVIRALPAHGTPGDETVLKRTREMADTQRESRRLGNSGTSGVPTRRAAASGIS